MGYLSVTGQIAYSRPPAMCQYLPGQIAYKQTSSICPYPVKITHGFITITNDAAHRCRLIYSSSYFWSQLRHITAISERDTSN